MAIPDLSLDGKVAWVTGARRGIGEACALVFAEAGADMVICDKMVKTGELQAVADKIRAMGRRCLDVKTDVTSKSEIAALIKRAVDEFGAIDILVNNAGAGGTGESPEADQYEAVKARRLVFRTLSESSARTLHTDEAAWDKVLATNLKSALLCSQAVAEIMIGRKTGNIINIASVTAFSGGLGSMSAYAVSKRGMVMLAAGLAADLARYNIRVNAIAPGGVKTELMRHVWSEPEILKEVSAQIPLGNAYLEPEVCAHAALFLASDLAAYITGQTIIVDAGLTL